MQQIDLKTDISTYNHRAAARMMRRNLFPHDRWILPLGYALILSVYVFPSILRNYFDIESTNYILLPFLAGLILLFYRIRRRSHVMLRELRDASIRRGQTDVHLNDTGMHIISTGYDLRVPWTHVTDVIDAKDGLLVLLNGWEYHPIPAASIPEGMTQDSLKTQIAAWIAAAPNASHV